MIIAIDLDEVLGDFLGQYIAFYNRKHKTSWRLEQWHSYRFEEVTGETREEQYHLFLEFIESGQFDRMLPFDDAIAAVEQLQHEHTLILITSRPPLIEAQTHAWLAQHYPGAFTKIHVTNQYAREGFWRSKADVCREEGVHALIEDNAEYANECAAQGVRVYLFTKPWNAQHPTHQNVLRVASWDEVLSDLNRTNP